MRQKRKLIALIGIMMGLLNFGFVIPVNALNYDVNVKIGDKLGWISKAYNFTTKNWDILGYDGYIVTRIEDFIWGTTLVGGEHYSCSAANYTKETMFASKYLLNEGSIAVISTEEIQDFFGDLILAKGIRIGNYSDEIEKLMKDILPSTYQVDVKSINFGYGIEEVITNSSGVKITRETLIYSTTGIMTQLTGDYINQASGEKLKIEIVANTEVSTASGMNQLPDIFGLNYEIVSIIAGIIIVVVIGIVVRSRRRRN